MSSPDFGNLIFAIWGAFAATSLGVRALLVRRWGTPSPDAPRHPLVDSSVDPTRLERKLRAAVDLQHWPRHLEMEDVDRLVGVYLLYAAVCVELGELQTGEQALARVAGVGRADGAWPGIVRARLCLASHEHASILEEHFREVPNRWPLPPALRRDTYAQLLLARGEAALALDHAPLPITRARILAVLGREREARESLRDTHPTRIAVLRRLYPDEPIVPLLDAPHESASPYR